MLWAGVKRKGNQQESKESLTQNYNKTKYKIQKKIISIIESIKSHVR